MRSRTHAGAHLVALGAISLAMLVGGLADVPPDEILYRSLLVGGAVWILSQVWIVVLSNWLTVQGGEQHTPATRIGQADKR